MSPFSPYLDADGVAFTGEGKTNFVIVFWGKTFIGNFIGDGAGVFWGESFMGDLIGDGVGVFWGKTFIGDFIRDGVGDLMVKIYHMMWL